LARRHPQLIEPDMTVPQKRPPDADLERLVDAHTADLSELLAHVTHCWDEDRRNLSRQLHDNLGSSLTALTMHLGLLFSQLPPDKALQERAALIKQLLASIISRNRETQTALWNDKFEFLGIQAALGELVEQFGAAHALTARLSLPEEEIHCPHPHGLALLRCAEEGLCNIAAHARADEVDLIVDDNDDVVMLTVRDNGVGLPAPDTANARANGHGLRLLRARAACLGGSLTLAANGERGCTLTLTLPKSH
jgi:signal transduction histidine kinase